MGMRVIAIDTGDQKRQLCERLRAEAFIDFKTAEDLVAEVKRLTGLGAHGALVTAASKQAFAMAPGFLRPGGTVVAVGIPTDPAVIAGAPPSQLISGQLKVVGSLVGGRKDVDEAFDFAARGLIHVSRTFLLKGSLLMEIACCLQGETGGAGLVDSQVAGWACSRTDCVAGFAVRRDTREGNMGCLLDNGTT